MDQQIPPPPPPQSSSSSSSNKYLFILVTLCGIIATILIFLIGYFLGIQNNFKTDNVAKGEINVPQKVENNTLKGVLALKEGTVEIKKNDKWISLEKGTTLIESDEIKTGTNSRAVIEFDDGSAVRLDQNSQVSLATISDETITLKQIAGRSYNRVHPGDVLYNVKSLNIVATAIGTSFSVNTDEVNQKTEVAVFESKVSLISKGESAAKEEVSKGQIATVNKDENVKVANLTSNQMKDDFYTWNQDLDNKEAIASGITPTKVVEVKQEKKEEAQEVKLTPTAIPGTFNVTAEAKSSAVSLNWSFSGSAPNGFKIVMSKNANPTYPTRDGDFYKYLTSQEARNYTWNGLTPGTTYHFRVGIYTEKGTVSEYSNDVTAIPQSGSEQSSSNSNASLTLSATSDEAGKVKVNWTLSGDPINGFKEVWADHANPTYPEDHWNYDSDTSKREYTWTGLPSGQTLHFRVGVYKSGQGVTTYSNDVTVTVK